MEKLSVKLGGKLEEVLSRMTELNTAAGDRVFTEDEQVEFDILLEDRSKLEAQIKTAKQREEAIKAAEDLRFERNKTGSPISLAGGNQSDQGTGKDWAKIRRGYSFAKVMAAGTDIRKFALRGLEAEMHQEAINEAIGCGIEVQGIGIPRNVINPPERQAMQLNERMKQLDKVNRWAMQYRNNVVATGPEGGYTVATEITQIVDYLWPVLQTVALGAQEWTGLQGNIQLPTGDARATAAWTGEIVAATQTTPTLANPTMSPNRLAAWIRLSKQLIIQSVQNPSIELFYANELRRAIQTSVDAAVINGTGNNSQPQGIIGRSGINSVVAGDPDGGAATWELVLDFIRKVSEADAARSGLAFLTTPGVRYQLQKTFKDTPGSGGYPIWETLNDPMNNETGLLAGYRAAVSNQVPSNLSKGGSTSILHAILFGAWPEVVIGNWGGMDVMMNPYADDLEGMIRVVANTYWDVHVMHEPSFAVCVDANPAA